MLKELDHALRRERRFRDPSDPLHVSDEHLLRYDRLPREEIVRLREGLEPVIARRTRRSHGLPVATQVLTALRFYSSGSFQSVVGDATRLHQSSVSRVIDGVTEVLYRKGLREIYMPIMTVVLSVAIRTAFLFCTSLMRLKTFATKSSFPPPFGGCHCDLLRCTLAVRRNLLYKHQLIKSIM